MTVRVFRSSDAGAPVLNGLVGSLCAVLDAVLVDGYGAKTAAGWATVFTGANKRIYRPSVGLLRGYLRVQDDAPRAAPFNNGCEARVRCSEAATTVDSQTGVYPWTTLSLGLFLRKSATADATARPWIAIADERTLYFFTQSGDYGVTWAGSMFGEVYSIKPAADAFNGMIICRQIEQVLATPTPLPADEPLQHLVALTAANSIAGHFMPRSWNEAAQSAVPVGKHGSGAHSLTALSGYFPFQHPYGDVFLSPVWVHENMGVVAAAPRGRLRGFWQPLHPPGALCHGDTWTGTGALVGKSFEAIGPVPYGLGWYVMETSDTWETN
jgi:hypothetical protein